MKPARNDPARVSFLLSDGAIVSGVVHGNGGVIANCGDARRRILTAQRRARAGRETMLYEPLPGHVRVYPKYSASSDGEAVDVDLLTSEMS